MSPVKGYDQVYSYVFITILFGNLLGMIPYALTITSFSALTFFLSFTMFIGLNIIALSVHH
jgi:F-type H+-transporting ATPase subunit a